MVNRVRILPDFVIIGAMKCGTTSLYDYLTMHPEVESSAEKEIHYFDSNYEMGLNWYRKHFPLRTAKWWAQITGRRFITGEASPSYLFHPYTPRRMYELIPNASLIVLLRNPIDRAYSHYQHQVRQGREKESFEDAIRLEDARLSHDLAMMKSDEPYAGINHRRYSYLARGRYVDQLLAFDGLFPKEQILILQTEELLRNPEAVYGKTLEFLGLKKYTLPKFRVIHRGKYDRSQISRETQKRLEDFYKPHNDRLYEYLGYRFDW